MSTYTHRDYDGDTLTFIAGRSSALVIAYSYAENESVSVDVPRRKAVEAAKELLTAAGVDAVIANGDDLR